MSPLLEIRKVICNQWENKRENIINTYANQMKEVEDGIINKIERSLHLIIPKLIKIGCRVTDDIGKDLENAVFELNLNSLKNRKEEKHFINITIQEEIEKRNDIIKKWDEVKNKWKDCRMEGAKIQFLNKLKEVEMSEELDKIFKETKIKQKLSTERLKIALKEWSEIKPPVMSGEYVINFEEDKINPIIKELNEIHNELKQQLKNYEV